MNGMKSGLKTQEMMSWGILLAVFIYMWLINALMPLHRDDYEYALIWNTSTHIANWADVFHSLYRHYFEHGGRMTDFFVLDSFLMLGKVWFNPFNAFLFIALIILIYWYAYKEITWRFNPYVLGLLTIFCWFGFPHFGEVIVWMTGACVYLLPAVLIFTFLLPYYFDYLRKPLIKNNYFTIFLMLIGGVISAWTIENTAAVLNFLVMVSLYYNYKNKTVKAWMVSGLSGTLIGYGLLVAAPGNYVRYAGLNTPLAFHFTNQLAGNLEMLLYVLPIILFYCLVWRILLVDYAKTRQIVSLPKTANGRYGQLVSISLFVIIAVMLVSFLTDGFVWRALADFMYNNIAVRFGLATAKLKIQFYNTMSGLEEMLIYLLTITLVYRYAKERLQLQDSHIAILRKQFSRKEILSAYPVAKESMVFIGLAALNNLVMLASPSFPGRACFGAVVFLIIGAIRLFLIPSVRDTLLRPQRQQAMALISAILVIPMAAFLLYQHTILYQENTQRMIYVENMAGIGVKKLELEPLSVKHRVLRHIFFVELNNSVSKGGMIRYYGLEDIHVKE